jgi:hypothetical protein
MMQGRRMERAAPLDAAGGRKLENPFARRRMLF